MTNFAERLAAWWRNANGTQRALVVGGLIAGIASAASVVLWSSQPDYVVLFSGLDDDTASQIVDELDESGVPFEVSRSGGTVRVPSDRVGELRLRIAGKGLTGGGTVGFEIFDKSNLGMTEFLQHVNYRRALEGELTRTIVALNEVQKARVHLAIPERSVFRREQAKPTASVIVDLMPGARLRDDQIRGIYALMAASVEDLDADGVTLIDASGRELGGGSPSGEFAATSDQLRIQREVEEHLRVKATQMLEQVVGEGEAVVQVTANLDFERVERSVEKYNPTTTAIRSEQRVSGEGGGGDTQETILTNYEIDKTIENILKSVGTIQRLSIAVLVNGSVATDPSGAQTYQERSTQELTTLGSVVQDAVGFDSERGDRFEIANMRFAERAHEDFASSPMPWWILFPSMGSLARALVILAAIGLVAWGLRQASSVLVEAVEADRRRREKVVALESTASEAEIRKEVIREQMNNLAQDRPHEVAAVLRSWLVEEKSS
jgi:flagellar M-ring protein FliF